MDDMGGTGEAEAHGDGAYHHGHGLLPRLRAGT